MFVESIELNNYRNFDSLKVEFSPGVNIFASIPEDTMPAAFIACPSLINSSLNFNSIFFLKIPFSLCPPLADKFVKIYTLLLLTLMQRC